MGPGPSPGDRSVANEPNTTRKGWLDLIARRLNRADTVAPGEPRVVAFAFLLDVGELPGIRRLKRLIGAVFVDLAPPVPVSLERSLTGFAGRRAAVLGAVVTLFFCLVVPGLWCLAIGRFSSDDPNEIFFFQDTTNLLLYAFVCPLYVALGCWILVAAITGWSTIRDLSHELDPDLGTSPGRSFVKSLSLVVLILTIALFSTAMYIEDIMDPSRVPEQYWFMETTASGEHVLGALGVYYFLLNYSLLIVTLVSITVFMSVFVSTMDVGKALRSRRTAAGLDVGVLRAKLAAFTEVYLLAKMLTFTYMVNFFLWQDSPLGATQNIYSAYIFLTLFGVFFVSFPRYFVELQWFRLLVRSGEHSAQDDVYDDLRPFWMRAVAAVLDTVIIGGFIVSMLPV